MNKITRKKSKNRVMDNSITDENKTTFAAANTITAVAETSMITKTRDGNSQCVNNDDANNDNDFVYHEYINSDNNESINHYDNISATTLIYPSQVNNSTTDPSIPLTTDGQINCHSNISHTKDLVHKCQSDPGGRLSMRSQINRSTRLSAASGAANMTTTTRKCVLTLDGYNYVIVASSPDNKSKTENTAEPITAEQETNVNSPADDQSGNREQRNQSSILPSTQQQQQQHAVPTPLNGLISIRRSSSKKCNLLPKQHSQPQLDTSIEFAYHSKTKNYDFVAQQNTPPIDNIEFGFNADPVFTDTEPSDNKRDSLKNCCSCTSFHTNDPVAAIDRCSTTFASDDYFWDKMQSDSVTSTLSATHCLAENDGNESNASAISSSNPMDLTIENLPAVDTPDACDKAATRLRCLLKLLPRGDIPLEILQKNLQYAARVLEALYIDETKQQSTLTNEKKNSTTEYCTTNKDNNSIVQRYCIDSTNKDNDFKIQRKTSNQIHHSISCSTSSSSSTASATFTNATRKTSETQIRLADEDDELSEVQPDAVPPEVREWLASTFTRQLVTTRKRTEEKPKFRTVAHAIRAGIFVDRIYRRVSSTAMLQFPPDVVKVLKTLDDWSFDQFALAAATNGQPIKYLGYDLLNRYGIIHKFKVAPSVLEQFLVKIEEGYCRYQNPYHNNLHAADVAQTIHYMLCQTGIMHYLTDLEIFAILIAALIHDYEHTGTTNSFHINTGSDMAMLYNDRAVLENHHASAAFRMLKEDEYNIFSNLSREEYKEIRNLVIDMVISTDMSFHNQQLKNMKSLIAIASSDTHYNKTNVDLKFKALSFILHCCDISHPAKKWEIHHRWTMLLIEEFFRQGDLERELGLDISPLCDRNSTVIPKSQIVFIEVIVEPSLAVCADLLELILTPIQSQTTTTSTSTTSTTLTSSTIKSNPNSTIDEETKTHDESTSTSTTIAQSPAQPQRIIIKKPWIACMRENKRIWKEQEIAESSSQTSLSTGESSTSEINAERPSTS